MPIRENDLIAWIRSQVKLDPTAVSVGPGDDCAVVLCGGERLLVTIDQTLDGTHFRLPECGARKAGDKALARSVSDIAAMAGLPLCAVVSASLPRSMGEEEAREIQLGLMDASARCACPLVGGDAGVWDGPLALSAAVIGTTGGIEPVLRSGGRPGDAICVTGSLGGAWRAGRDLHITPRIAEARILAQRYGVRAMMDLSDGLSADLPRLCTESRCGAEIIASQVPVHDDVRPLGEAAALQAALNDGEDYELLFTLSEDRAEALLREQPLAVPVARIGMLTIGSEITLILPDGGRRPLQRGGWEHSSGQ